MHFNEELLPGLRALNHNNKLVGQLADSTITALCISHPAGIVLYTNLQIILFINKLIHVEHMSHSRGPSLRGHSRI